MRAACVSATATEARLIVSSQFGRSAELNAREFNRRVADPALFSGGGSVAALAAAGAGALTLLVGRLAARRKSNAHAVDTLRTALAVTETLIERFYSAADLDLVVLDRLLDAQRALKHGGKRGEYADALREAARSPLQLADDCVTLLGQIELLTPFATRFTVSDLSAAAALSEGACRAALHTADVNIALLHDESSADEEEVGRLAAAARRAREAAAERSGRIQHAASRTIVANVENCHA